MNSEDFVWIGVAGYDAGFLYKCVIQPGQWRAIEVEEAVGGAEDEEEEEDEEEDETEEEDIMAALMPNMPKRQSLLLEESEPVQVLIHVHQRVS